MQICRVYEKLVGYIVVGKKHQSQPNWLEFDEIKQTKWKIKSSAVGIVNKGII